MHTPIRSYRITTGGDIKVTDFTRLKDAQDISKEYQNIAEDRRNRLITAWLDVEVDDETGRVEISHAANGKGIQAARDAALLFELFSEDLKEPDASARSFAYMS